MRRFLLRRLLFGLFALFSATIIVFTISRLAGDPILLYSSKAGYGKTEEQIQSLKEKLGLDRALTVQYFVWVGAVVRGDFGRSLVGDRLVTKVIREKIGATFQLGVGAWLFATAVGIPLGVLSAVRRGSPWDYLGRGFALFGQALPTFWVGMMGILLFAVTLDLLPAATKPTGASLPTQIKHLIMPVIVLGWLPAATYLRLTRSAMLDVLHSEFITLARGKGVSSARLIWKHAFRNALIPPLTVSALLLAGFINGSVVVETVFAWPGIGRLAVQSVWDNDFPVLTATVLLFALFNVVLNFCADVLTVTVDPRIRYS